MAVVQAPFIVKNTCAVGGRNPLQVAHGDVAHAGDGGAKLFHNVANGELVGELRQVHDVVVIGQANTV